MKEDFLHYLWRFKKFETLNLRTAENEELIIVHSGDYLENSGPDFFNAQIIIGGQKWAGNVEIHLKSSDWYNHFHERDKAYDNVILHVVWENDMAVFRENNTEIPVLVLKEYVSENALEMYHQLTAPKSWIYCEKQLTQLDDFVLKNWQERLFFERLERKSKFIYDLLKETNQDWEAVLFILLAKNFGLNTNGQAFLQIAKSIPFSVIRKEGFEAENLEALLFGIAGLLDSHFEDVYFLDLKIRYLYLINKYQIEKNPVEQVLFFKHRPDNFPTIRLAQLAGLYNKNQNLFSEIINLKSTESVYRLLKAAPSPYWQSHYLFDKASSWKAKFLSNSFIDLLILNTIIPIQFAYASIMGESISDRLVDFLMEVPPEKNAIIDKFALFGIKSKNAFETQSMIELKNEYCNKKSCLKCALGLELLKNN
ncbi:DUF2851 family protein [Flavobacterium foetidum]|uniref:DUF2851 family protein n=1 Tax=Flavobacterium foetidum TaxID=2026681 RepID=UPI001074A3BD|nr:DUF2851 family protein [Flavobacterium foetidum]KAF2515166.1 DUF2851 family protein [Flavobacterium foetidum]